MTAYLHDMDHETGFIKLEKAKQIGKELHEKYQNADPFPHIIIDNFFPDSIARKFLGEFELSRNDNQVFYNREQEKFKREFKPDELSKGVRDIFYIFNSRPFISIVENITGIKGLIPDPYFLGAGLHEIQNGGRLAVHADFNHHRIMNVERRVNLLIYLNEDWSDDFGGQLELWTRDMASCSRSIVPIFNRAVLFNTTSHSNHGNPQTVNNPHGISRKSIALYYYSATWDGLKRSHGTQFRPRKNTTDAPDWSVKRYEFIEDVIPPIVLRGAKNFKRMLLNRPKE